MAFTLYTAWTEKLKQVVQIKDWKKGAKKHQNFAKINNVPTIVSKEFLSLLFPFSININTSPNSQNAAEKRKSTSSMVSVEYASQELMEGVLCCFQDLNVTIPSALLPLTKLFVSNFKPVSIPPGYKRPEKPNPQPPLKHEHYRQGRLFPSKPQQQKIGSHASSHTGSHGKPLKNLGSSSSGPSRDRKRFSSSTDDRSLLCSKKSRFSQFEDERNVPINQSNSGNESGDTYGNKEAFKEIAQAQGLDPNNRDVLCILELQKQLESMQSLVALPLAAQSSSHPSTKTLDTKGVEENKFAEAEKKLRENIALRQQQLQELEEKLRTNKKKSYQPKPEDAIIIIDDDVCNIRVSHAPPPNQNDQPLDFKKPQPKVEQAVKADEIRSKISAVVKEPLPFKKPLPTTPPKTPLKAEDCALPLGFGKNVLKVSPKVIERQTFEVIKDQTGSGRNQKGPDRSFHGKEQGQRRSRFEPLEKSKSEERSKFSPPGKRLNQESLNKGRDTRLTSQGKTEYRPRGRDSSESNSSRRSFEKEESNRRGRETYPRDGDPSKHRGILGIPKEVKGDAMYPFEKEESNRRGRETYPRDGDPSKHRGTLGIPKEVKGDALYPPPRTSETEILRGNAWKSNDSDNLRLRSSRQEVVGSTRNFTERGKKGILKSSSNSNQQRDVWSQSQCGTGANEDQERGHYDSYPMSKTGGLELHNVRYPPPLVGRDAVRQIQGSGSLSSREPPISRSSGASYNQSISIIDKLKGCAFGSNDFRKGQNKLQETSSRFVGNKSGNDAAPYREESLQDDWEDDGEEFSQETQKSSFQPLRRENHKDIIGSYDSEWGKQPHSARRGPEFQPLSHRNEEEEYGNDSYYSNSGASFGFKNPNTTVRGRGGKGGDIPQRDFDSYQEEEYNWDMVDDNNDERSGQRYNDRDRMSNMQNSATAKKPKLDPYSSDGKVGQKTSEWNHRDYNRVAGGGGYTEFSRREAQQDDFYDIEKDQLKRYSWDDGSTVHNDEFGNGNDWSFSHEGNKGFTVTGKDAGTLGRIHGRGGNVRGRGVNRGRGNGGREINQRARGNERVLGHTENQGEVVGETDGLRGRNNRGRGLFGGSGQSDFGRNALDHFDEGSRRSRTDYGYSGGQQEEWFEEKTSGDLMKGRGRGGFGSSGMKEGGRVGGIMKEGGSGGGFGGGGGGMQDRGRGSFGGMQDRSGGGGMKEEGRGGFGGGSGMQDRGRGGFGGSDGMKDRGSGGGGMQDRGRGGFGSGGGMQDGGRGGFGSGGGMQDGGRGGFGGGGMKEGGRGGFGSGGGMQDRGRGGFGGSGMKEGGRGRFDSDGGGIKGGGRGGFCGGGMKEGGGFSRSDGMKEGGRFDRGGMKEEERGGFGGSGVMKEGGRGFGRSGMKEVGRGGFGGGGGMKEGGRGGFSGSGMKEGGRRGSEGGRGGFGGMKGGELGGCDGMKEGELFNEKPGLLGAGPPCVRGGFGNNFGSGGGHGRNIHKDLSLNSGVNFF